MIVKESLSEHCGIFNTQLQGRSNTDSLWSALENVNTSLE